MDATRSFIAGRKPLMGLGRLQAWLLDRYITHPARSQWLGKILYGYQRSGLQWLLRKSGALTLLGAGHADALIPRLDYAKPLTGIHPARGARKGTVALFTGCVAGFLDVGTQLAAVRLLNALGYDVHVPPTQGCCGALHLHAGDSGKSRDFMHRNLAAFSGELDAIITTASGCGALLREYPAHVSGEVASTFSKRVADISQFLVNADWSQVRLKPLTQRVAVHDPCTLANAMRQEQGPYTLLKKIPQARVTALPENEFCCGGAGTYPLTQPHMAKRLREEKIRLLRTVAPDILVTSNIGCALQLGTGVREAGLRMEVIHPVVLLERQLET
jgi:glycolate oxidase iron-sulfur subunit